MSTSVVTDDITCGMGEGGRLGVRRRHPAQTHPMGILSKKTEGGGGGEREINQQSMREKQQRRSNRKFDLLHKQRQAAGIREFQIQFQCAHPGSA